MEREAEASEHRPDMVAVAVMGGFVLKNVGKDFFVLKHLFCNVNRRFYCSEKAGSFYRGAFVNRKPHLCSGNIFPGVHQFFAETEVRNRKNRAENGSSGEPDTFEHVAPVNYTDFRFGDIAFLIDGDVCFRSNLLNIVIKDIDIIIGNPGIDCSRCIRFIINRRFKSFLPFLHKVEHGNGAFENRKGNKQPYEHESP